MILISLWYWEDLNVAVASCKPGSLAESFRSWRWIASAVAAGGALVQMPLLGCAASPQLCEDAPCAAWIEAPLAFHDLLASSISPDTCGMLGLLALGIYVTYLLYLSVVVLPVVGRMGLAQRPSFTWITPLEWLGLLKPASGAGTSGRAG
eukprot:TRINITY_DN34028_c0_g1_i2.p1 TRINITY_DN34028_c0_g1~~TRINITY_DN34028_c0_g1_i2.p1  ORF type:complete len:150 (+),score=18.12 TRINITY_DN34028_c0_g1_i2:258-707(+)